MHEVDFALGLFLMVQPVVIALVLFIGVQLRVSAWSLFLTASGSRRRLGGVRFFECAANPRLIGRVRYTLPALTLCILFILYDVDLIFFFAETSAYDQWGPAQLVIACAYAALFWGALWYDSTRCGFIWDRRGG